MGGALPRGAPAPAHCCLQVKGKYSVIGNRFYEVSRGREVVSLCLNLAPTHPLS